uniref:Reverse transcriptase n=1 Tax=Erpetoichthys calabaricus TaxID=27687 RepID=A0A8C4T448_ERPCA
TLITVFHYFKLEHGTRQGCPLSPLLFAIAIEPLEVHFRNISGLKINLNKSVLFPVNSLAHNIRLDTFPFIIADQLKCLTSKHKALYQLNFAVCMEKLKQDLHRWSTLHLTLAGRINTVKINILPKLPFLFQSIPIYINKTFFNKATLQRPKAEGGMALPNFQFYCWAAKIQAIKTWTWTQIDEQTQAWSAIEKIIPSVLLYIPFFVPQ